jgi:uncharacterized protein
MLLDLSRVHGPSAHVERTFQPAEFPGTGRDYEVVAPVQLSIDVEKKGERYRVAGKAETMLELPCGRCVEPYRLPVQATFDLLYLPRSENQGEGEREIAEDDLDAAYYDEGQIDLGDLLREQFYLALPMKPLCSEGCQGLCPVCGTNRNTAPCGCEVRWTDPRLAGLEKFGSGDEPRE